MNNFTMYNPTQLHFGQGMVSKLGATVAQIGHKALLIYGKGSIKTSGAYDQVMGQLKGAGITVVEYGGIRSNPIVEDVDAAAELAREHQVDVIVAVGGGSVIDSAKIISITIPVAHSAWEFYSGKSKPVTAIPLLAVLTLAATGSEMNRFAVLQNHETRQKLGYRSDLIYPRHAFLDPAFTISVPANYTAYGIADLIAHGLEVWFGEGDAPLSDKFIAAIIREAMEAGPLLMKNLHDYDLRARIMYAATSALNGFTLYGKVNGDWGVHNIGHTLSFLYDIPHGASLTIAYPAWLKLQRDRIPERLSLLFREIFGNTDIDKGILAFEKFFEELGCPIRLRAYRGIQPDQDEIIKALHASPSSRFYNHLSSEDYVLITKLFY